MGTETLADIRKYIWRGAAYWCGSLQMGVWTAACCSSLHFYKHDQQLLWASCLFSCLFCTSQVKTHCSCGRVLCIELTSGLPVQERGALSQLLSNNSLVQLHQGLCSGIGPLTNVANLFKSLSKLWNPLKNYSQSPGWCGSMDWALACKLKGCWFNSQSGHMPGLWARCPVGGTWEATTYWCFSFSPSLSASLPRCLQLNKTFKKLSTEKEGGVQWFENFWIF